MPWTISMTARFRSGVRETVAASSCEVATSVRMSRASCSLMIGDQSKQAEGIRRFRGQQCRRQWNDFPSLRILSEQVGKNTHDVLRARRLLDHGNVGPIGVLASAAPAKEHERHALGI